MVPTLWSGTWAGDDLAEYLCRALGEHTPLSKTWWVEQEVVTLIRCSRNHLRAASQGLSLVLGLADVTVRHHWPRVSCNCESPRPISTAAHDGSHFCINAAPRAYCLTCVAYAQPYHLRPKPLMFLRKFFVRCVILRLNPTLTR